MWPELFDASVVLELRQLKSVLLTHPRQRSRSLPFLILVSRSTPADSTRRPLGPHRPTQLHACGC